MKRIRKYKWKERSIHFAMLSCKRHWDEQFKKSVMAASGILGSDLFSALDGKFGTTIPGVKISYSKLPGSLSEN